MTLPPSLVSKTYWAGAPFEFRQPPDGARVESLSLRAHDYRRHRALYWTPASHPAPRVAVVCIHPRVDFTHHYTFPRLLAAGIGCLGANTRHPNNDVATVHEELLLDVASCVRFLKDERGVDKVILLGNSGGGSLSAFYQAEARKGPGARLATTPGGAPTHLRDALMIPADAMIYVSAHRGQGRVLLECIDPAVVDEGDPLASDPALDMYAAENGFAAPPGWSEYSEDFVRHYRAAQRARVKRLDARAKELIAESRRASDEANGADFDGRAFAEQQAVLRSAVFEPVMVVYRTMANLHYVDRHLDPSSREYGSLLSERPDLMNLKLLGFARLCTPEAWLSTWSGLSSNADLVKNLALIPDPTLVVHAGRDREIYPATDAQPIFEAVAARDKTFVEFEHARHYFEPDFGAREAPDVEALMNTLTAWIQERSAP
jgi:pimeloyl-ACP methyl ester carboxylesterase